MISNCGQCVLSASSRYWVFIACMYFTIPSAADTLEPLGFNKAVLCHCSTNYAESRPSFENEFSFEEFTFRGHVVLYIIQHFFIINF